MWLIQKNEKCFALLSFLMFPFTRDIYQKLYLVVLMHSVSFSGLKQQKCVNMVSEKANRNAAPGTPVSFWLQQDSFASLNVAQKLKSETLCIMHMYVVNF